MLTILCGIDSRKRIRGVTLTLVVVEQIDAFLAMIQQFISRLEFARQPRSVKELPRWKSPEYRVILHYHLQQFVKRQVEEENCKLSSRPSVPAMLPKLKCVEPHNDGPLVQNLVGCQFYTAQIKGIGIIKSRSLADSCVFLSDMSVIEVKNFVIVGDATVVIGHLYKTQQSYSVYPFQSSNICEYLVSELSTELRAYDVYDILYKAVRLPTSLFLDGSFLISFILDFVESKIPPKDILFVAYGNAIRNKATILAAIVLNGDILLTT
ncbi:hypothetical protein OUZ56_005909 [Daphnia magna]|uniref:Uncharacterized protein n=1 Tax=Daphnia magna TaxID=35525 RepID=A0ABQ9YU53_9CRUS|nr:hypothetical protein OUZ56_005909 [Daphnia magna]